MNKSEFETLKLVIQNSDQLNSVDIGDIETLLEAERDELNARGESEIKEMVSRVTREKLLDGANLIDLFFDTINFADTIQNDQDISSAALMEAFWDAAAEVIIDFDKDEINKTMNL